MKQIYTHFWILILVSFVSSSLFGQAPTIEWEKTIGGSSNEMIYGGYLTTDGDYVLGGYVSPSLSDFYLLKTDGDGNIIWEKTYGLEDRSESAWGINSTSDGGSILVGACDGNPPYTYNSDTYLVKTDADGNFQWESQIGADSIGESCSSVMQTLDGGYIMCGSVWAYAETGWDVYVVKTFSDGSFEWQELYDFDQSSDRGMSVIQTADGGFAIAGKTQAYSLNYGYNAFILKISSTGITQWLKTYGYAWPKGEEARQVFQTSDNGFFISGSSSENGLVNKDWYVVKTNEDGDSLWQRTIGDYYEDVALGACETSDGGFAVTGTMYADGNWNSFMVKYNGDGDTLWTKQWGDTDYAQNEYWIDQTDDEGFIVAGQTNTEFNNYDVHLTKFSAETIGIAENEQQFGKHPFSLTQLSPNPCNTNLEISYSLADDGVVSFSILDIHGRTMMHFPGKDHKAGFYREIININTLQDGVYVLRFCMENHVQIGKICVVH